MSDIAAKQLQFIASAIAEKKNVLVLTTACCQKQVPVLAPPKRGKPQMWDSLMECPYCHVLNYTLISPRFAQAIVPARL